MTRFLEADLFTGVEHVGSSVCLEISSAKYLKQQNSVLVNPPQSILGHNDT